MKFSHFFIERPIFASVISILIVIVGAISFFRLPITQYPNIVPPSIAISTKYAGATPEVIMDTVVAPIEQEVNGVEHMLYISSQCGADGTVTIDVTFEVGTSIDIALVQVQSRVSKAESRLPKEVRDLGVTVRKRSPDMLVFVNLISPKGTRDKLYLTNYAITQIQDRLSRVYGVSEFNVFGAKEYCMRIWMNPERLEALDLSAAQVVNAIQEQNKQIAPGKLNAPPLATGAPFELMINAQGRLQTESEFENIIVKSMPNGRIVRLKDVARIQLDSYLYGNETYINSKSTVSMGAYQLPGSNAIETAKALRREMEEIKKEFPADVDYLIGQDTTEYISESISKVYSTIFEAVLLVVFVVMAFLQNWRAAVIPLFAIPVSLIGTFFMMYAFGFSINNLTLFGLVLAIGIVVDDAIVVVENVERNMKLGLKVKDATKQAMTQVQGALIAIVLVLSSVFLPTAFLEGISGQFYRQFAMTIASSTIISGIVSLTLTPALCAAMLTESDAKPDFFTKIWNATLGRFFALFNRGFDFFARKYGAFVARIVRFGFIAILLYVLLLYGTFELFSITPKGFIPKQDQGVLSAAIQLPDGASFERTEEVAKKAGEIVMGIDGVKYTLAVAGRHGSNNTMVSNAAKLIINLDDRAMRDKKGLSADKILHTARVLLDEQIMEADTKMMTPPPVRGIGSGSDFKFQVQDRVGFGIAELEKYTKLFVEKINETPMVSQAFTSYTISNPQLFVDIDRTRAQKLNVPISSIFSTMQYNLGSIYVNDFNLLGRVYRVVAQADAYSRKDISDIYRLKVPNEQGENVPLGSLVKVKRIIGPDRVMRYNLYTSAEIQGNLNAGYSTGQVIEYVEALAKEVLPEGMGIEWTDIAYQEKRAGNTSMYIFALCVVFVFLLLAALYESWTLPLSVILIVPLVLLFAIMGVYLRGMNNNLMTQIGFIVLIGLACKNAILIVEFAHQREMKGEEIASAVSNASKNRLRPIIMTSLAFILGVVPLAFGHGAGFELRQALGTSVFFGMIGVTVFGCVFTPIFYYAIRSIARKA